MKKNHILIPVPSSKFQKVVCAACEETLVVYSHASSLVTCNFCGNTITEPTGSKANMHGKIAGTAE